MVNAYANYQRAKYLRLFVVNPLHPLVPCVPLSIQATCNQFTAEDVAESWETIGKLWEQHLRPILGPLWGHGSDGDARRFTNQKAQMSSTEGSRFRASWHGFVLTGIIKVEGGDFYCLPSQDTFHNCKKCQSFIFVPSRDSAIGSHLGTWWHIELLGDTTLFCPSDHGLTRRDIIRKDPMSVKTVQATCSRRVEHCLKALEEGVKRKQGGLLNMLSPESRARFEEKSRPPEDALGTRVWLHMIRLMLRVFVSTKDSLETRYELCATVVSFLRIKRHWINHDNAYNLTKHAESKQCFEHACLQLESAALKIEAFREFFKDKEYKGPCYLARSGSDCCETLFSKIGGFGSIQLNRRNFNMNDALEMIADLLRMAFYEFDPECPLVFKKANTSLELCMADLEDESKADTPDADLCDYPSPEQCRAAGDRGLAKAQEWAAAVGMDNHRPRKPFWAAPWKDDKELSKKMRDADAEDNVVDRIVDHSTRETVAVPEGEVGEVANEERDFVVEEPAESDPDDPLVDASPPAASGPSQPPAPPAPCAPPAAIPRRQAQAPARSSPRLATMRDDGNHVDAIRARSNLRDVYDEAEAAMSKPTGGSSEAAEDSSEPAVSCYVTKPDGAKAHKSTVNVELLCASATGDITDLSPDRLVRRMQHTSDDLTAEDAAEDGEATRTRLQRGADIAQAFANDSGDGFDVYIGRIQAIYKDSKAWVKPIDFESRPSTLQLVCRWYSRVRKGSDVKWKYNQDDVGRVFAQFTLCLPDLTWDSPSDQYTLSPTDRAAIKTATDGLKALHFPPR